MSDREMVKTFIRIPKSGSTSFMSSLSKSDPNYEKGHLTAKEIMADGRNHKFYCIVRDPLEQYISMYYFAKNLPTLPIEDDNYDISKAFIEHIDVVQKTKTLAEYLDYAPKNAFLGKYLSNMDPSDLLCVGRLDRFDESLALISKIVGIPTNSVWLKKGSYTVEDLPKKVVDRFILNNALEYHLYTKSLEWNHRLVKRYL